MTEIVQRNPGEVDQVPQGSPVQQVIARVRTEEFMEQLAMALPENVPASRFVRAAVTALLQNPALAEVDRQSFNAALLKCAQDGLLPDGRESALVPYKGKAQYLPMIGGYRKIAGEHGWTIETHVVYDKDEFSYELGLDPRIDHRPAPINSDRGELVAAYAIGRHRDGRRVIEVYEAAAIAAAKGVAQTDRVWRQWPAQMWEKTVGKRLFAKLPLDPADKRIKSLVDAEVIGPDESARLLYGSGSGVAPREIEARKDSPQGAGDAGPEASGEPAGDGGGSRSGDEPGADGAPSVVPGAEPPAPTDGQTSFQIPDAVVDAAGAMLVQDEWTVAHLCNNKSGREFAAWVCGPKYDPTAPEAPTEAVVSAIRTYVTARHPELLPEAGAA